MALRTRASTWSKSKMLLPTNIGSIMRKYSRVTDGLPKASPMPVTPGIGLDLDQPALPAEAAAARHAVGLFRGEGIFQADEGEASDDGHGELSFHVFHLPRHTGEAGRGKAPQSINEGKDHDLK